MKTRILLVSFILGLSFVPGVLGEPFIYPSKGQTAEQQQKDQYECSQWATGQTGYNPMAAQQQAAAPQPKKGRRGGVMRGAVRGAAIGEIVDDNWEDGAKAGALIGGMRQRDRNKREQQAAQQALQEQAAQQQAAIDAYNRASGTCLQGRGYTIG